MTDKETIEHLRQQRYSFARKHLYRVLPAIKKYIRNNNGTTNDAEDIFHDALVILCKKVQPDNFTLTVSLYTYLLAIVKNCWLQELKKKRECRSVNQLLI